MVVTLDNIVRIAGFEPYKRVGALRPAEEIRTVYNSKEARAGIDPQKSKFAHQQIVGVTAVLNRFVEGAQVSISTPLIGNGKGTLKGLEGYDDKIFEFRFFDVAPQLRMLGVFPQKDVFLGCQIITREDVGKDWNWYCKRVMSKLKSMGKNCPECMRHSEMNSVLSNWRESK